jgi:hypothetical protein
MLTGPHRVPADLRQFIPADVVGDDNVRTELPQSPLATLQIARHNDNHEHAAAPPPNPGDVLCRNPEIPRRVEDDDLGSCAVRLQRALKTTNSDRAAGKAMLQPRHPPGSRLPDQNLLRSLRTGLGDADSHTPILEADIGP